MKGANNPEFSQQTYVVLEVLTQIPSPFNHWSSTNPKSCWTWLGCCRNLRKLLWFFFVGNLAASSGKMFCWHNCYKIRLWCFDDENLIKNVYLSLRALGKLFEFEIEWKSGGICCSVAITIKIQNTKHKSSNQYGFSFLARIKLKM